VSPIAGFGGWRAARRIVGGAAWLVILLAVTPATALGQFGRNKLQYEVFDFKVLRTAHFDIYYYPREREAALDAARLAERSYARLSRILGHEFEERKPILLYASHSQFQQTNALPGFISEGTGGVTEFAKRRVIMPFTGSYADFEHVLTHELVHAFQYDVIARGLANQLDPTAFQPPLWFMEGMAEYLSIGRLDTHTRAWLRDAVLSGYLRTIPEMSLYNDYLSYRFGQSLWAYIGGKYGDETIGLLLQRAMRLGLEGAVEVTLGISLARLSDEWIEMVRTTYLPDVAEFGDAGEVGTRLTAHAFKPGSRAFASYVSPALSPDGRRLVYLSDRGNDLYSFYDLWLASAEDGKVMARLVRAARTPDFESLRFLNSSAAWSPDGRHLAFVAKVGGRDALYIYDVDRRRVVRRITVELDGIQNPTFSPDGLRVAFTGLRGGISDLYVVDVTGEHFQQLTDDKYADLHPSWSPDGQYIAIATDRGEATDFDKLVFGNFRIALYDVGRGDVQILPYQDEGKNINPAWSPDGDAIAFVSDRTGVGNVFLWSRAENRLYQVTDLLSAVTGVTPLSPAITWAARADRLAFTYFEGAGFNVYVVDDPRSVARLLEGGPVPALIAAADSGRAGVAEGNDGVDHGSGSDVSYPVDSADVPAPLAAADGASQSFYRILDGFRPSAARPDAGEVVARKELTVAALLEDSRLGLPDTASFERREYEVRLTPDVIGQPVIGAQVGGFYGSGVYGGSYILLSDILGDHNVLLWGQLAGSFDDAYILTQYTYLRERANLSMAYQQFPLYRFWGTTASIDRGGGRLIEDRFQRDVYRILTTEIDYPFNTFQRLEISAAGFYVSRDSVIDRVLIGATSGSNRSTLRLENMMFAGPSVALVWDNTLFGFTGPIAGRRYRIELGRYFGDIVVNNLTVDLRNYFNLGGQYTLAARLTTYSRSGPDERQFRLYWGGPYFIRGYDGGSFSLAECAESAKQVDALGATQCPVRDQLIGSSVAFASAEFRFPIFNFLDLRFVPLGLPPVDGVVFFDMGAAFDSFDQLVWSRRPGADPYRVREPVAAVGAGIRVNILYNVFRVDYAYPLDRPDRGSGVWSLSFGPTF
jgi:Tol biopolymer transport system component